jgi:response regulator of citrate/malate metabolism|tara:strand:+ start:1853 stop:2044 length:192 start_codon:yes stop_codon:yes gene_type:complete
MLVSEGISHSVMLDYEERLAQGTSKQMAVKNLAKIWSLTLQEVVQIIREQEADNTASKLGEIV